jgi:predicted DNA-binding antitoxin AbrB/MazE fold protein
MDYNTITEEQLLELDISGITEPEEITKLRDVMLGRWEQYKVAIEDAQERENLFRSKIIDVLWPEGVIYGKERIDLYNGYRLEIEKTYNIKVDQQTVRMQLEEIAKRSATGPAIAERLIKWKGELVEKEFDSLQQEDRVIIGRCVTKTPAKPTVKIIAPTVRQTRIAGKTNTGI